MPMYMDDDKTALSVAIRTCNGIDYENARVVRIKNTLELTEIEVSEAFVGELKDRADVQIISAPYEMQFDQDGFLN